jgi:ArsR family transcriptional regulator, virulence genes transcriptional regulator
VRADQTSGAAHSRVLPAFAVMQDHAIEAAIFLKALANDQRLLMLCCLIDGALSVGEINERVPLSQSALSQHLGVLRDAGLVTTTRKSQTVYYALAQGPALNIMEILYSAFCAPSASKRRTKKAKVKSPRRN